MHRRLAAVAKWMDHVNARSHCVDVFDRLASLLVQATLFVEDAPVRGNLQILSTHILIVDDGNNIVQSIELDHIHSIKRYQEVLFPNRTFAELPRFRSTLELYITNAAVHKLVLDGDHAVRISQFIELLWKFHFGKMATRQELTCRGFHLGDALYALSLLPLDLDCTLSQQIQGSAVVNVEKSIVLRIDEGFQLAMIFRPETLADTAHARAIELNLDQIHLISTREDEVRIVCEDGRAFLLHSVADHIKMLDHFMCVYLLNAATMVYRRLHFNYPFFTFRHSEVLKLYDHYLHIDSNGDGHISQEEFNATLGPILVQVRSVPKALYALCDCLALSKVRLFEYLHGFRVLLKGNYQDRVRYLFLLFDTKRQGSISYLQFLEGLKTLATSIDLGIPKGESLETMTFRLFNEMDVNRDNSIQFDEFEHALKTNFGLNELLRGVGSAQRSREEAANNVTVNPSRVLSFGHPQWVQICQILYGIETATTNAAAFRDGPETSAAQNAKFTYHIPSGSSASASSFGGDDSGHYGAGGHQGSSSSGMAASSTILRNPFAKSEAVTFSDYSPAVFEAIRQRFGVQKHEYLLSLGFSQTKRNLFLGCLSALYEMSSSGRSGSFFYSSTDNRYILKTIPHAESQTLRKILPSYLEHIKQYPNTLLTRFCGLHALSRGGVKMIFVVMQNIFLNAVPILETFDLKGSTVNRSTPHELRHLGVALKDNDFEGRKLPISAVTRDLLVSQLEADSKLLTRFNLNDYSFLLGIHKSLDGPLPPDDPSRSPGPKYNLFQKEYGGIRSSSGAEVYFVGIIDCLTDYGIKKMGEHISKSVLYDSRQVSCVPPGEYQKRYNEYLGSVFTASE